MGWASADAGPGIDKGISVLSMPLRSSSSASAASTFTQSRGSDRRMATFRLRGDGLARRSRR